MKTTSPSHIAYHIIPQAHGWKLACTDPAGGVTTFPSVREAMQTALLLARERAPSEVRMYSEFGELVKDWYFESSAAEPITNRIASAAQR